MYTTREKIMLDCDAFLKKWGEHNPETSSLYQKADWIISCFDVDYNNIEIEEKWNKIFHCAEVLAEMMIWIE